MQRARILTFVLTHFHQQNSLVAWWTAGNQLNPRIEMPIYDIAAKGGGGLVATPVFVFTFDIE